MADNNGNGNGWSEWKNYVLNNIEKLDDGVDDINKTIAQLNSEIYDLKNSIAILEDTINELKIKFEDLNKFKNQIIGVLIFIQSVSSIILAILFKN